MMVGWLAARSCVSVGFKISWVYKFVPTVDNSLLVNEF